MNCVMSNRPKPFDDGCRVCGRTDERLIRGLCQMHYRRFASRQKEIAAAGGEEAGKAFEEQCLADGWILPKSKGGRPKDEDPFDVIAARMVAEMAADIDAAVARDEREQAAEKLRNANKPVNPRGRRRKAE